MGMWMAAGLVREYGMASCVRRARPVYMHSASVVKLNHPSDRLHIFNSIHDRGKSGSYAISICCYNTYQFLFEDHLIARNSRKTGSNRDWVFVKRSSSFLSLLLLVQILNVAGFRITRTQTSCRTNRPSSSVAWPWPLGTLPLHGRSHLCQCRNQQTAASPYGCG